MPNSIPPTTSKLSTANAVLAQLTLNVSQGLGGDTDTRDLLSKLQLLLPEVAQELGFSVPPTPEESESTAVTNAIPQLNKRFLNWSATAAFGVPLSYHYLPSVGILALFSASVQLVEGKTPGTHQSFKEFRSIGDGSGKRVYFEDSRHAKHAIHELLTKTFPTCTITRWETEEVTDDVTSPMTVITRFSLRINDLREIEVLPCSHPALA